MKTTSTPGTFARPTSRSMTGTLLDAAGLTVLVGLFALVAMYPLVVGLGVATTAVAVAVARGLSAVRRTRRGRTDPPETPVRS
jgi:hypothetical protein